MNLIIFGAQGYALGTYKAIKELDSRRLMPYFLVSDIDYNERILDGIPVRDIKSVSAELSIADKQNTNILIATPVNVQPEIEEILELYGFHHYSRLTSSRWRELMRGYHSKTQFQPLSSLPVGCDRPFIRMYSAKSHVDRALRHPPILPDYVFPIQVGRANADRRIADIVDNTGDNISNRNGNYSELTGLYWLWKNKLCESQADSSPGKDNLEQESIYYGFCQYRRMLTFADDDLLRLTLNDVDAVLPYPLPYDPNIHAHHERYINDSDWEGLLTALEELEPEYSSCFDTVLSQQWLYNYNVIFAKKSVLRDYCSWLFPILQRTEEITNASSRSDRYIGYMAETLETLYFMKNKSLHIAHTVCEMYS